MQKWIKLCAIVICVFYLGGCAARPKPNVDPSRSLYERLGGKDAITAVVKDFTKNIAADERINGFFIGTDLERIDRLLIEQICQATGGPCQYSGRSMVGVHTGLNITEAQFNALVEDLVKSLNHFQVPEPEKQELLKTLGSLKNDIINR